MTANVTDIQAERDTLDEGHFAVLHPQVDRLLADGHAAALRAWNELRTANAVPMRNIDSHVAAAALKGPHNYNSSTC
jgi:hypothetical protein